MGSGLWFMGSGPISSLFFLYPFTVNHSGLLVVPWTQPVHLPHMAIVLPISFSWSHFPQKSCMAVTCLSLFRHHFLMRVTLTILVKIPFPHIPLPCFEFYLCTSSYLLTNYIFYLFILHIVFALHTDSQEILKQFIVWERLPWWLSNKESTCKAGASEDAGLITGQGISPGGGHGNPLQYSCLENPCTELSGGLQSMGLQRVRHNWSNLAHMQSLGSSSFDHPAFRVLLHPVIGFSFTLWIGRAHAFSTKFIVCGNEEIGA